MNDSLHIAATGLHVQQMSVDTIANNLANVNTPGFKKARVSFQDLMYREVARSAIGNGNGTDGASAVSSVSRMGSGVSTGATLRSFAAGEMKKTDAPLDIAIRGDGFLEVTLPDGSAAYTRGGSLQVNRDGYLATAQGYPLKPSIHVAPETAALVIDPTGRILARTAQQADALEIGRFDVARFANPGALAPLGDGLYRPTEGSGDARTGRAGEDGFGTLAQGYVEASNVTLIEEMVELMIAQRAYEVSTKVVQASDEMMAMTNNLRK